MGQDSPFVVVNQTPAEPVWTGHSDEKWKGTAEHRNGLQTSGSPTRGLRVCKVLGTSLKWVGFQMEKKRLLFQ